MEGAAIAFCPSISFPAKPRRIAAAASRFYPVSLPSSEQLRLRNSSLFSNASSSSIWRLSPIGCSLKQSGPVRGPNSGNSEFESGAVTARAAAESAGPLEAPKSKSLADTLVLGLLFGLWFVFNIYFNIYNKQVRLSSFFSSPLVSFWAAIDWRGHCLLLIGSQSFSLPGYSQSRAICFRNSHRYFNVDLQSLQTP